MAIRGKSRAKLFVSCPLGNVESEEEVAPPSFAPRMQPTTFDGRVVLTLHSAANLILTIIRELEVPDQASRVRRISCSKTPWLKKCP